MHSTSPTAGARLVIAPKTIERNCPEREIFESALALDGRRIVELGCGRADLTRLLAKGGPGRQVTAFEVDAIQHAKNLQITDLPNVRFQLGGAEAIPAGDASFDVAFMFKSLHHVPVDLMAAALREVARVLKPGGLAYLSEPIFDGPLNQIVRLFHDEQRVREAAFAAIRDAVAAGVLESVEQIFFNTPRAFADFAEFERVVLGVTHTQHVLSADVHAEVRRRFEAHLGADGARFLTPIRVDLLRKP